ncbi:hypothetical protein B296_00055468, partial [Ensete ventricosum]
MNSSRNNSRTIGKTRTAWYIPVRQLTGTRTGRYRAVALRSAVDGRFSSSMVDFRRLRPIEEEKGKKKKRKRRRRRRRRGGGGEVPRVTLAATLPGGRSRA